MRIEPIPLIGLIAVGTLYAAGIYQLRLLGRRWPRKRSVPFFLGLLCVVIATQTEIAYRDTQSFTMHVVQHLFLAMGAPPLLCLGAPLTLWLQSAPRKLKVALLSLLHSRCLRVVSFPLVTWMIFVATLFILYFSFLYELSLRNTLFHDLVHVHYILAGFLYFAPVVAIDPYPWRMHYGARLLYVGLSLPAHAFLALALLTAATPLAADWYLTTTGNGLAEILRDQKRGAAVMWIASDLLAIAVVGIVATQWARADERDANREDRFVARGLDAPASP